MFAYRNTFKAAVQAAALSLAAIPAIAPRAGAVGLCEASQFCLFSAPLPQAAPINTASEDTSGHPCGRGDSYVRGSGGHHEAACAGVRKAVEALGRCGIRPSAVLYVEVAGVVRGPDGTPMFGRYDRADDIILVAASESIERLARNTPFEQLPARDVFESLVVHETVHAIMEHNMVIPARTRSALEYPAFALQIHALPDAARDRFLQQAGEADGGASDIFSDAILMLDPFYFAARAYRHFMSEAGGCKSLQAIVSGRTAFIAEQ